MNSILTIIPARKNSKRIPGKNLKIFSGLPLIEHILKVANELPLNFKVVVNTDDIKIEEISKKYDKIKFLLRPNHLASDDSPAIEYVKHTLENVDGEFSAILILQPTSPFTTKEDILECEKIFFERKPASLVSVVRVAHMHHPDKFKIIDSKGNLVDYLKKEIETSYDKMSTVFIRNCSIYFTDINVVKKFNKIIFDPCIAYEMPASRSIDINENIDFEFAEFLMSKKNV